MADKWIHEDGPRVGYETFTRPGQPTADKLNALPLRVLQDYVRPLRPGEKPNLREEPDVSDTYRRGGRVRHYADGGDVGSWGTPAPQSREPYGRLLTPAERDRPAPSYTYSRGNPYSPGGPADRLTPDDIREIKGHPTRGLTTDQILWLQRREGQFAAPTQQRETGFRRGGRVPGYVGGGAINTTATPVVPGALAATAPFTPDQDTAIRDAVAREATSRADIARQTTPQQFIASAGSDSGVGTGGVGGSATDGSGGSSAAGVGGADGGTYRRGGPVRRFAAGGSIPHFDTGGYTAMSLPQQNVYDPKDYVGAASSIANDLTAKGNEFYDWAGDQFNKNEGTANQVIGSALNNANLFDNAAAAGLSRYQDMYAPAMKQHLDFASNFATPAQLEAARGRGIANVGQAYDAQSAAAADALRGEGLDPKAIGMRLDSSIRTKRAADSVAAGNTDVLNREIAGQTMLGQSIGLGQADANLTNQFAGVGAANRNQAVNTGNATTQTGALTKAAALPFSVAGANELKEWPKAELDAMHAQNEQGALWNDINRTNIQGQQVANASGSGAGAIAGGALGALSSMVKFAPITLSHGGMIPHAAGGGEMGSTWRKFAYGNPIGVPEAIDTEAPGIKQQKPAGYGGQPFEFKWPGSPGGDGVTAGPPPVMGGEYLPGDLGGAGYEPFAAGNNPAGIGGPAYRRGGSVNKFYNAGSVPSTTDSVENYSRQLSGMDPTGYAGFATDALSLGRDLFDPSAQDPEMRSGDKFGITGPYQLDQGEEIGGDVGRPIGRFVGGLFGAAGPGAQVGEGLGTGVGAMVQGRFGEGLEDWGRAALAGVEGGLSGIGGMGGGGGGGILNMGGGSGMTFADGGQIPMGPLGHLAHFIGGGAAGPYDPTGPVTPPPGQSGAIQTGDIVPASAQIPGVQGPDKVPAMVAAGEGILPKEVMDFIGKEGLKKIIDGAYKRMGKPPQPIGPEEGPTPEAAIQTGPTFASQGALT